MRDLKIDCAAEPKDRMLAEICDAEIQITATRGMADAKATTIVLDIARAEQLSMWLNSAIKAARTRAMGGRP